MINFPPYKRCISILLIITFVLSCSTPPAPPEEGFENNYTYVKEYMTWHIKKMMKKNRAMGLSVALVDEGAIVWAEGFGMADKKNNRPASAGTLYKMGSISKLFTATAIMQLEEQGLIDLDAPVSRYIPEFTYKTRFKEAPLIKVRDLMTHHSGLQGDRLFKMFDYEYIPGEFHKTVDWFKEIYTAYPPGHVHAYCNMGVDLLGIIIERVSGENFEDYMKKHVLDPLEMTTSSFYPLYSREEVKDLASRGYEKHREQKELFIRNLPAGSLNSSVMEMAHFMTMMMNRGDYKGRSILSGASMAQMYTPQNSHIPLDNGFKQGLNFMLSRPSLDYAGAFAGHDGSTAWFVSSMGVLLDHNLGVIVVANSPQGGAMVYDTMRLILQKALEVKAGITPPPAEPETEIELLPEQAVKYEGTYALTRMGKLDIKAKKNKVYGKLMGFRFILIPVGENIFQPKLLCLGFKVSVMDNIFLEIKKIEGKNRIFVHMKNLMMMPIGEAVTPEPIPEAWQSRQGTYEIIDPDYGYRLIPADKIHLKIKDDFLTIPELGILLKPMNDEEAVILGLGRGAGETIFADIATGTGNGETHLFYSGMEWRKK